MNINVNFLKSFFSHRKIYPIRKMRFARNVMVPTLTDVHSDMDKFIALKLLTPTSAFNVRLIPIALTR